MLLLTRRKKAKKKKTLLSFHSCPAVRLTQHKWKTIGTDIKFKDERKLVKQKNGFLEGKDITSSASSVFRRGILWLEDIQVIESGMVFWGGGLYLLLPTTLETFPFQCTVKLIINWKPERILENHSFTNGNYYNLKGCK